MADVLQGLMLLTPEVLLYVALGVLMSTIFVITPGLGGLFALAIILPFAFTLGPVTGIALMLGVSVVSGTGNTIPSILFGIPGSASGVASTFDGLPMSRRGEGVRAVSAGLVASALGGVLGAVALAAMLPVLRPIVLMFRPPEFFALILLALVFMAFVGRSDPVKGLISGGIGLLLSLVGLEVSTGTQRYTFEALYLYDGLSLVPVVLGLYAVTEMMDLMRRGTAITETAPQSRWQQQMRTGVLDPFRHWKATVQSSLAGLWVGLAPGLGDSAAQFVGYGQVARTSKRGHNFGNGEVEGVIGADAATNSKEGGALIPTLAFGVPGSASMAILIAAFLAFGLQPGPSMLQENADIVWMILWILVIANLLTTFIGLALTPLIAKLTEIRASLIVGPILVASIFGSYAATNNPLDVVVLIAFGFLGWFLKRYDYARSIVLIGFVLGELLEQNYLLSMRTFGIDFLRRPLTLVFFALIVVVLFGPFFKRLFSRGGRSGRSGSGGPREERSGTARSDAEHQ